jgi:spermidine synthase
MELWFTERQKPGVGITCKVRRTLHREITPFQEIAVLDTEQFGRMLVLDGMIQTTIFDEIGRAHV